MKFSIILATQSQCEAGACKLLDCRFQRGSLRFRGSVLPKVDLPRRQTRQQQVARPAEVLDLENERLLLREDLGEQRGEFFGHVAFRNQDLAFLQPDAPGSKVDFGEAYEDEAKNRSVRTATRVFLGLELGIVCKLCLLGSVPNSF